VVATAANAAVLNDKKNGIASSALDSIPLLAIPFLWSFRSRYARRDHPLRVVFAFSVPSH